MAQFGVDKSAGSYLALAFLALSVGLIVYAVATATKLGGMLYLVVLATIVLGFSTKEDSVAIGGVMSLCFVVILDIYKHIAILG